MSRKYDVHELDALRLAVESKWLFGSYGQSSGNRTSRSYASGEKAKDVEEMVRTHMLAGHTADDLIASERPTVQQSMTDPK